MLVIFLLLCWGMSDFGVCHIEDWTEGLLMAEILHQLIGSIYRVSTSQVVRDFFHQRDDYKIYDQFKSVFCIWHALILNRSLELRLLWHVTMVYQLPLSLGIFGKILILGRVRVDGLTFPAKDKVTRLLRTRWSLVTHCHALEPCNLQRKLDFEVVSVMF